MIINEVFVSICIFLFFVFSLAVLWRLVKKPVESYENVSEETTLDQDADQDVEHDTKEEESEQTSFSVNHGVHRRDSKIGSSLEFAYIDESCLPVSEICDDSKGSYEPGPAPTVIESLSPKCETTVQDIPRGEDTQQNNQQNTQEDSELPHQDLYDKYLEPRPEVDSPYGFVFFPNKYWKQFQQKPPVCVPTSKCDVQPTCTNGVPVDVLDYTQIGSIMPKFEYKEEYTD